MGKHEDLTGKRFCKWTVIGHSERSKTGRSQWLCRCDCGTERNIDAFRLKSGQSKSCGCAKKYIDITGKRFGRLVVIEPSLKRTNDGAVHWVCKCDCGKTTVVNGTSLRRGVQISCRCMQVTHLDTVDRTKINHKKHGACPIGERRERLYGVWDGIKQRCYNENLKVYKYYGGRGISVCDLWKNDYAAFREWAFSNGYDPNAKRYECTIDRIDNNGNYEPDNCRFVDMKTQAQNKRKKGTA